MACVLVKSKKSHGNVLLIYGKLLVINFWGLLVRFSFCNLTLRRGVASNRFSAPQIRHTESSFGIASTEILKL